MKRHLGLSELVRRRTSRATRRATRGALGWWAWSNDGDLRSSGRRGRETRAEHSERRSKHARRGSTLLVVLALLGMLLLLGMLYFTFSSQEQANATNFAEAAKHIDNPGDDIDAIFDKAIKQLIQGADPNQPNSVMSYRHSVLGTFYGKDLQPFSGAGVHVLQSGGLPTAFNLDGSPYVDPNGGGYDLLEPNDSQAAQRGPGGQVFFKRDIAQYMPASDVDYTYPDINNMFLAYKSYVWFQDPMTNAGVRKTVLKPSFHRPELFRDSAQMPRVDWATHTGTLGDPTDPSSRARLMRPHPDHAYVWRQQTSAAPVRRFLNDYDPADGAIIAGLSCLRGFPFHVVPPLPGTVPAVPVPRLQGVWSQTAQTGATPAYQYDSDNDGDGIPEGIWMDLDLPVQIRPSDSKTYLPMISFTVYDLDALLNLNIHGNLSNDAVAKTNPTVNFGTTADLSLSAMGLGPNEVNLLHALDATPGVDVPLTAVADHTTYFGHVPANQRELANMELWWLMTGRFQYPVAPSTAPPTIVAGRNGEANRLWRVLSAGGAPIGVNQYGNQGDYFSFAGFTYTDEANRDGGDDNRDENEGREAWLGGATPGVTLAFGHPLALHGRGRFWGTGANFKLINRSTGGLAGNPMRWIGYDGMGLGYDRQNNLANAAWYNLLGGNLMTNTVVGANYKNPALGTDEQLMHDTLEINLERKSQLRPYDEPFESLESIWLHMSNGDRSSTGLSSRAGNLMSANLTGSPTYPYPFEIAQRFTTESWDVKQFALMNAPDPLTATSTPRVWEWNVDFDGDGLPEFPPQFNPPANYQPDVFDLTSATYNPANAFGPRDPFRPQLRRLLATEFGDTKETHRPARLSVNDFLDVERKPGVTGDPFTTPLQYRALTPHITSQPATPITALPHPTAVTPNNPFDPVYTLPPFPPVAWTDTMSTSFTQEAVQEFWAQRDRQQMARDIYVMLYTFCGGNDDTVNVTTTAGSSVHSPKVLRQMAQFAVNLVDSLDRDNVITAFEFDTDLSNGWGLDDDATGPVANDLQGGDRAIVFGVEAQQLTFSEILWLFQPQATGMVPDHPRTAFDETAGDFHFFQIELRSTSPLDVDLSTTTSTTLQTGVWRIVRDDDPANGTFDNQIVFQNNAGVTVPAGGLFTVASADTSSIGAASLYVDHTGATTDFELVAPNVAGAAYNGSVVPAPAADLDLLHSTHTTRFVLGTGAPGDFMSRNNNPTTTGAPLANRTQLRLERRLNPYLPNLPPATNPFVPVDSARADRHDLQFDGTITTQADAAARLSATAPFDTPVIASRVRQQPMNAGGNTLGVAVGPSPHLNSIGQNNATPVIAFPLHLSHFDRDYASVVELFNVPLYGPGASTRNDSVFAKLVPFYEPPSTSQGQLERGGGPYTFGAAVLTTTEDINHNTTLETEDANGNGILDAGEDGSNGLPGNGQLDVEDVNGNGMLDSHPYRFHRLLSLVEVPTRTHRQLGDPLKLNRVPGKINLNTLRDRHVHAALLDDREAMTTEEDANRNQTIDPGEDLNGDGQIGINDPAEGPRDWWNTFLYSREGGLDPTTGLPLPITGLARPFRDLANVTPRTTATGANAIDDTILRRMPVTISPSGRGLFELTTEAEHTSSPVDPLIRDRLLSKIIGNTTTRSNVFVVFATIGMFECYEDPATGAVRIGGQMDVDLDGSPDSHRAVFIIDRSDAEEAYDKGSRTFDWKKLVLAKQRVN